MIIDKTTNLDDEDIFAAARAFIRNERLTSVLLGETQDTTLVYAFSGSSDSGNWVESFETPEIETFMNHLLEHKVTFDWYNNEGGGGDITWDLRTDAITINGYENVTGTRDVMCETI